MYVLAAVELEATEAELFLLAGDSEPRGSRRRLISMLLESLAYGKAMYCWVVLMLLLSPISGVSSSAAVGARKNAGEMQDDHLTKVDASLKTRSCCSPGGDEFFDEEALGADDRGKWQC